MLVSRSKSHRLKEKPPISPGGFFILAAQYGVEQLVERPNVPSQSRHHCRSRPLLAALAKLPRLPAIVVVNGEHGERGSEIFQLLGKAQHQPVEPL
jgi:hypothetical protein